MSGREPRFEIVRSDAEQPWHARFLGANGQIIWTTEQYSTKRAAKRAIERLAQSFSLTPVSWTFRGETLYIYAQGVGARVLILDERTP